MRKAILLAVADDAAVGPVTRAPLAASAVPVVKHHPPLPPKCGRGRPALAEDEVLKGPGRAGWK